MKPKITKFPISYFFLKDLDPHFGKSRKVKLTIVHTHEELRYIDDNGSHFSKGTKIILLTKLVKEALKKEGFSISLPDICRALRYLEKRWELEPHWLELMYLDYVIKERRENEKN